MLEIFQTTALVMFSAVILTPLVAIFAAFFAIVIKRVYRLIFRKSLEFKREKELKEIARQIHYINSSLKEKEDSFEEDPQEKVISSLSLRIAQELLKFKLSKMSLKDKNKVEAEVILMSLEENKDGNSN